MATKRIRIGGIIKDAVMRDLTQAFTTLGYKAARDAYRSKTYKNRTFNLHDSYGSAVYVNGKLVEDSIRYVNRSRSTRPDRHGRNQGGRTGRQALKNFFKTAWVVRKRDNFTILVAAAMWYAKIVEDKGYVVLNHSEIKQSILSNFDSVVRPVLKKHNIESLMPALRRGIGADMDYYRERMSGGGEYE